MASASGICISCVTAQCLSNLGCVMLGFGRHARGRSPDLVWLLALPLPCVGRPALVLMLFWVSLPVLNGRSLPSTLPSHPKSRLGLVVFFGGVLCFSSILSLLVSTRTILPSTSWPLPPALCLQTCETGGFTALVRSNTSRASSGCHFPPPGHQ